MAKEKEKATKEKTQRKDKIKCVKCNGQFAQRPDVRENRIKQFGSAANLEANYLCRVCRKGKEIVNGKYVEVKEKVKTVKKK